MSDTENKATIDGRANLFSKLLLSPEKTIYSEEEIEEYNQNLEEYIEAEVNKRVLAIKIKLAEKNTVAKDESVMTENTNLLSLETNKGSENPEKAENSTPEVSEKNLESSVKEINDENVVEDADVETVAPTPAITSTIKSSEKTPITIASSDFDNVAGTPAKSVHKYLSKDRDELSFLFEDVEREYQEIRSENDRLKQENDRLAFELDDSKNKLKVFEKIRQRNKEKKANA